MKSKQPIVNYNEEYSPEMQKIMFNALLSDPDSFARVRTILDETYFHDTLRKAVRFTLDFADEFKALPAIEVVKARTGTQVEKFSEVSVQQSNWLLQHVEGFCRYKALEGAILEGANLLQKGEGAEIERRIKDAMTISLMSDLGTSYFDNPMERLERMKDKSAYVSTGWKTLDDKLYGGFARGTLNIFCGGSGCVIAGTMIRVKQSHDKTPRLIPIEDLADVNNGELYTVDSPDGFVPVSQWRNKGVKHCHYFKLLNGMYATVSHDHLFQRADDTWAYARDFVKDDYILTESGLSKVFEVKDAGDQTVYDLAIDHTNHRYYTNGFSSHNSGKSLFLQNIALNWVMAGMNVVYFTFELSEELVALRMDAMISGEGTKNIFQKLDFVADSITLKGQTSGKMRLKRLPAGSSTNDLIAYLKEYEIKTGIRPEAIVVDYLDLMYPNNKKIDPSDQFIKDKFVSEELRELAHQYNVLFATASQLNRSSVEAMGEFDHSHIAGGISKINTADNVFGIFTTNAMKEKGQYVLQFLKTRSSGAVGQKIELGYNNVSMRILDAILSIDDPNRPSSMAEIKHSLKKSDDKVIESKLAEPPKDVPNVMDLIRKMKKKDQ